MTGSSFPRVLVLSPCTFNYTNGGGVTFSNLFSGWDPDRLANLHASDELEDHSVCRNFFRMSEAEIQSALPSSPRKPTHTASAGASPPPSANPLRALLREAKKIVSGNSGWPRHFRLSPELDSWLREFRPEIIYTILGPIPFMEAALEIRDKFNAKLVVHHMDDWYPSAYTTGIFSFQRRQMLKLFHRLIEQADLRLTIGEAMAEEYQKRFSLPYLPFQNTIDVNAFIASLPKAAEGRGLLYFGSIHEFAQEQSLVDVAHCFAAQKPGSNSLRMRIVAPAAQLERFGAKISKASLLDFVPMKNDPNQFNDEIGHATALLLPANFDANSVSFLRYSMPTKLPGYMASGRPILIYGPAELAQTKYAEKYRFAETVDSRQSSQLDAAIKSVMTEEKLRERLVNAAKATAFANHDAKVVRKSFQLKLSSLLPSERALPVEK